MIDLLEFFCISEVEHPIPGMTGRRWKGVTPASYRAIEELKRRGRMTQTEFMQFYMGARRETFPGAKDSAFLNNFGKFVRTPYWVTYYQNQIQLVADEKRGVPAFGTKLLPKDKLQSTEEYLNSNNVQRCIGVITPPKLDWHSDQSTWTTKNKWGRLIPPRLPDQRASNDVAPKGGNMLIWLGEGTPEREQYDRRCAQDHYNRKYANKKPDESLIGTSDEWMIGDHPDMEK